jgi:hypothetical protein
MLAREHPEVAGVVWQHRRMSPIRKIREMIFEYEDARRVRMGQDAYVREQGYQQAKAEDQEQLVAKGERIRQLEEEIRRLRGE